ncbi:MAG TPA: mercuric reductase [Candidatus Xenobia bacterium]|nr:mercuric reductase [Candidatus Xenobia bacterium]
MATKYDAVIIGSGQGGNPLAHKLADRGWKVALVERKHLGGTCINTGCTPTKTMVASAQVAFYARHAERWGVRASNVSVDLAAVVERKDKIVASFRSGQEKKVAARPTLTLYRAHARFTEPHTLQVGEEVIEGERIFINTGTRPMIPKIEGLDQVGYLTNASVMSLRELPMHLIVIGGGYIGLEFGQMFYRFGSQVTVVHKGEHLLAREDNDVADELQKILSAEGMRFVMNADTQRVEKKDGQIYLTVSSPAGTETIVGTHLLVATGRVPNADDLGLDAAGIERDPRGFVKVNNKLETNVPGVWALGDVKGGPAFTHISYNDYQILWANLVEGKTLTIDNRYLPYSMFTDPQVGRVGLTETDARKTGRKLKIGKIPMSYVARAIERDETAGFMKVVIDAETDRILGAAILGLEGGELVQLLGALMLADAPWTVLKGAVYIHPTLAEGFFTLMEDVKPVN